MHNTTDTFDRLAAEREHYTRRHWYYYRDLQRLMQYLIPKNARVIELGCGIGTVISALSQQQKTGIDLSPAMIERAAKKDASTTYLVDDAQNLRHSESYDYVLLLDTINSLRDVQEALSQVRVKLCHDRTRIVITFYNFLWEPLLRLARLLRIATPLPKQSWFSRYDVRSLLHLANFEVVTEGERLLLPVYIPLISAFFNSFLAHLPLIRRLCLVQYVVARPRPFSRKEYSVSIVVPARNEAGNLRRVLSELPEFGLKQEIIFVEGHSTDDTWQVIQEIAAQSHGKRTVKALQQDGKGKADAVRKGFDAATHDILMILDADLTVAPEDLPKFYEAIALGVGEFINGSRLVYPIEKEAMQLLNMFANKTFGMLFSFLLGQRVKDTLCGTKVLLRTDYEHIAANRSYFGDFDPFGDFDLLFGASKLNLAIVDVPVRYRERSYGSTNIQRFRHGVLLLQMFLFAARKMKFRS